MLVLARRGGVPTGPGVEHDRAVVRLVEGVNGALCTVIQSEEEILRVNEVKG